MAKYAISRGMQPSGIKVLLYGTEGIGKSTFASRMPAPVFIDTEGSTRWMNVDRLPPPSSWAMLLDEVAEFRQGHIPGKTLVIDTADWAERLCIDAVCAKASVAGIEGFGYGKGYVFVKEEYARLLDELQRCTDAGYHVVLLAHASVTKTELPEAMGSYDRWAPKLTKYLTPLVKEWADLILFANYRIYTEKAENGKTRASGGARVMYTTHHTCWDAKNRFGLPEMLPFDFAAVAHLFGGAPGPVAAPQPMPPVDLPPQTIAAPVPQAAPAAPVAATPTPQASAAPAPQPAAAPSDAIPPELAELMAADNISPALLQRAVFARGCYPRDTPIQRYDPRFTARMVAVWDQWRDFIAKLPPEQPAPDPTADRLGLVMVDEDGDLPF